MKISLSAFAPENLVSRDRFDSPVPRMNATDIYLICTSCHLTHVNNNGDNISKTRYSTPSTILCTLNSFLYIQVLSLVYSASNFRKNGRLKHSLGNLVHIQPPKVQSINSTPSKTLG